MSKIYLSGLLSKWLRIFFVLLFLTPSLCYATKSSQGNVPDDEEYNALMAFFNSTNGDNWRQSTNWGNGTSANDFTQWFGITIDNGDVVGIELPNNSLKGVFPKELAVLSELRILSVASNFLGGGLPDFEKLNRLVYVDVSQNELSGDMPKSISNATSLTYLNLSFNQLTGSVLQQLQSNVLIEQLYLSNNHFAGSLPYFFQAQWPNIVRLDISHNSLTGILPVSLSALTNLQELYLNNNQLNGIIPIDLGYFPSLRVLNISNNKLSGIIPQELAALPNLQYFAAVHNNLTSTPDFRNAPYLGSLGIDVSYNNICFGPLESNATGPNQFRPASFSYDEQTMPVGEDTETQRVTEPIVLTCSFSGEHNTYQWYKKNSANAWQPISGATAAIFRIGSPVMGDAGRYACQVSNSWIINLTLWTRTTNVVLTADNAYLPLSQPASNLERNWTIERTYDGQGNDAANILAESKQFTDGLGRATQAQARSRATPHVFASETIYSTGGQAAVQTLAAPIDNQSFAYKSQFAAVSGTNQTAIEYGPNNFEGIKANGPDPINSRVRGQLGYYYSTANELEPLTPATDYPFSLTEPSEGPLGGIKRAASPGEAFRMGAGHEAREREIPLLNEFDHYMSLRHHFVPGSSNLTNLYRQGTKSISIDGDGRESVVVTNKEGQTLVTCLTNALYPPVSLQAFISTNSNNSYDANAPHFRDIHIPATGEHRLDFTVAGKVRILSLNGGAGVSATSGSGYLDSLDVTVQPSQNNTVRTSAYLLPGFYRLISLPSPTNNPAEQTQWFSYQAEYGNFSYTYYDDGGRVVATVAPKGLPGENVAKNASFDLNAGASQPAEYWQTDGAANVAYTESSGGAHSGLLHGTHYSGSAPYYAFTHQLITGLPNGRYTLRAWVKGSGGQNKAYLLARNFGGAIAYTTIPATPNGPAGAWALVELPELVVSNGQCDIGFESDASAGQFIYFDDVVLAHLPDDGLPSFVTRNTYDTSSRLLSSESTEEGRTEYVYARDGRIRFSQSALQRPAGRFSYSNYDAVGRVVESGEYQPTSSQDIVFENQLPKSTIYEAEAASYLNSPPLSSPDAASYQGTTYIQNLTGSNKHVWFTNISVPSAGTYVVRFRYAAALQGNRTMAFYVNWNYLYHVVFPSTGAWTSWDTQTLTVTLNQGNNQINLQVDTGDHNEGWINLDYLEVVEDKIPTSTSVLNLLEDRTATGGLNAAHCSQRNQVWYDETFHATESALTGRTQDFTIGAVSKTRNDNVTTWYSYDELGRVTWVVQSIAGLGVKNLDYKYDVAGNVLEVAYQHGQPDAFHHYYEYDQAQRLYKVYTSPDGTERTLQAKYFYYLHGPLKRVEVANRLQGIDYTYTLQGWLKSLNHVNQALDPGGDSPAANGVPKDLFSLTLDYFTGDYQSRNLNVMTPTGLFSASNPFRYDGTIRAATWRTAASPDRHQFLYQYDAKSQFVQSTYGKLGITGASYHFDAVANNPYAEGGLNYDFNGNIQSLHRTDKTGLTTDNFSYEYTSGTNRLRTVHGGGSPTGAAVIDYEYDALGQMTREHEGAQNRYLKYDVTGKVTGVYSSTASNSAVVTFTYDDKGFRSSKANHDDNGDVTNTTTYVRDVAGNILSVYESNYGNRYTPTRIEVPLYGSGRVGVLTHLDDGTATGHDEARYELNDHLGDARVVFHRPTTTTVIRQMELNEAQDNTAFSYENTYRTYSPSAHSPNYAARLDGRTAPAPMARSLSVVKGDTVTFSAWSLIASGFGTGSSSASRARAARLKPLILLGGTAAQPTPAIAEGPQPQLGNTAISRLFNRVVAGVGYVLGNHPTAAFQTGDPLPPSAAWIKYRLEYEDGTVDEHRELVPLSTNWRRTQVGVRAQKGGTLIVSVGTVETSGYTLFDDLTIEQTDGMIVQEQHQYAYGSPLVGLNYAVGNKRYRYGYQGQFAEKDGETGFESFELRMYNSRIGRWTSYDPEGEFDSPYVGMGNNPVSGVDPNGGCVTCPPIPTQALSGVTVTASRASGAWAGIGARALDFGLKGLSMYGRYGNATLQGEWDALKSAGTFAAGLSPWGANPSYQQANQSMQNLGKVMFATPSEKIQMIVQAGKVAGGYLVKIPDMTVEGFGHDVGFTGGNFLIGEVAGGATSAVATRGIGLIESRIGPLSNLAYGFNEGYGFKLGKNLDVMYGVKKQGYLAKTPLSYHSKNLVLRIEKAVIQDNTAPIWHMHYAKRAPGMGNKAFKQAAGIHRDIKLGNFGAPIGHNP